MSRRRQQTSWIQRRSRLMIAAIASVGALGTAYLTAIKLMGDSATCPTEGCEQVLSSPYAEVFGVPLTLFGFLGYLAMGLMAIAPLVLSPDTQKELRLKVENLTWLFLFMGATAMTVFSGYLMYVLAFRIQAACIYCIVSALLSLSMFLLTLFGRAWTDGGQLIFTGLIVAVVTLVGTLGVYANIDSPRAPTVAEDGGQLGPPVTTTSGEAEIGLAQHLNGIGAKMYSAYWCPHCHSQKQLFGQQAVAELPVIECDPDGANSQTSLCQAQGPNIQGFPTWEINGQFYSGTQTLSRLAELSGYQGPRTFQN
jgi:uncharacterized membrane protein/glutaredoxin